MRVADGNRKSAITKNRFGHVGSESLPVFIHKHPACSHFFCSPCWLEGGASPRSAISKSIISPRSLSVCFGSSGTNVNWPDSLIAKSSEEQTQSRTETNRSHVSEDGSWMNREPKPGFQVRNRSLPCWKFFSSRLRTQKDLRLSTSARK